MAQEKCFQGFEDFFDMNGSGSKKENLNFFSNIPIFLPKNRFWSVSILGINAFRKFFPESY